MIDDTLDFVVSAEQFGKPVNADLKLGLATAPVLYAAEMYPELWPLIERKFNHEGDVAKVTKYGILLIFLTLFSFADFKIGI